MDDPRGSCSGLPIRIENKIVPEPNTGCWLWTGSLLSTGYGRIWRDKKELLMHRVVYEFIKGPIGPALEIDHLCRTRACCNPDHLEVVTSKINSLRGYGVGAINARKTHCANGHELIPPNIYANTTDRKCIACNKLGNKYRYANKKKTNNV
jgi:HNH endonuclease